MVNRLIASIAMACAVVAAGSALAQDLPKQSFKVVGTWSNLTNWQQNEQPFWAKTVPEASKGQITRQHPVAERARAQGHRDRAHW